MSWATFLKNHAERMWVCDFIQTHDLWGSAGERLMRCAALVFSCENIEIGDHGPSVVNVTPDGRGGQDAYQGTNRDERMADAEAYKFLYGRTADSVAARSRE